MKITPFLSHRINIQPERYIVGSWRKSSEYLNSGLPEEWGMELR